MELKSIEIARLLNISPATVSLVKNNKPGVSNQTRQKVLDLIKESSSLNKEDDVSQKYILFVMHKTHGQVLRNTPFFQNMLETIQHIVVDAGYQLLVLSYSEQYDLDQHIEKVKNTPAVGILLLAAEMREEDFAPYKSIDKPIVVIDAHFPTLDVDCVGIDNEFIVRKCVDHLVEMGHSDIGYLSSTMFTYNFFERLSGYRKAMDAHSLPVREENIIYIHSTAEKAYFDMLEHLRGISLNSLPTAFVAGNDFLAIGAIKAFKQFGYCIPNDISIVSIDNMPVIKVLDPPLTSIDIRSQDMDHLAMESLLAKLNHRPVGNCRKDVRGKLIIRDSVKKLSQ